MVTQPFPVPLASIDSSDSDYSEDKSSSTSNLGDDYIVISETGIGEGGDLFREKYSREYVNFSPLEMEELKVTELSLMERNATNYCCYK